MSKSEKLIVRISAELKEQIELEAKGLGITVSELIRFKSEYVSVQEIRKIARDGVPINYVGLGLTKGEGTGELPELGRSGAKGQKKSRAKPG